MSTRESLNLDEFFHALREKPYAIIKPFDLDSYDPRSDVDLFSGQVEDFCRTILLVGNRYVSDGYEIEVTELAGGRQVHVDFCRGDTLEFRFDIYGDLPAYRRIKLRPSYFARVLAERRQVIRDYCGISYPAYFASEVDELVLCYAEYFEYYQKRPEKIKHLDYVFQQTSTNEELLSFLRRLHWYTRVPDVLETDCTAATNGQPTKKTASTSTSSFWKVVRRVLRPLRPVRKMLRSL